MSKAKKQVIDGRTYDTETATEIGSYNARLGYGDLRNYIEALYITRKGRFFLSGEGGPLTHWARRSGNNTRGSSGILALTLVEALRWAETHDIDADVIAEHFKIEDA